MNVDRSEALERLSVLKPQKETRLLKQAEVQAKHLTNDPSWNTFISMVEAELVNLSASIKSLEDKLSDPKLVGYNEMIILKMELYAQKMTKETLDRVITFPRQIIDKAKED